MTYLQEPQRRKVAYRQLDELTLQLLQTVGTYVPAFLEISPADIQEWYSQSLLSIPRLRRALQKQVRVALPGISTRLVKSGSLEILQHAKTSLVSLEQTRTRTQTRTSDDPVIEDWEGEESIVRLHVLQAGEIATATLVNDYREMLRKVLLLVSVGAATYTLAATRSAAELADKGITGRSISTPTGGRRESFVRTIETEVEDYVSRSKGQTTLEYAEEFGFGYVEVSAHYGARPTHAVWQGEVYSLSYGDARYPNLYTATGYGTGEGLKGYGCRHEMWEYIPEVSKRRSAKIDLEENARVYAVQQSVNRYKREQQRYTNRATVARAQGNVALAKVCEAKSREKAMRASSLQQTVPQH